MLENEVTREALRKKMVTAPAKRELVRWMGTRGLSERRCLGVVGMSASALRYEPRPDRNVAKAVARGGIVDQYSARGSSAKSDNARTARVLTRIVPGEIRAGMPPQLTPEIVAAGDALRLDVVKLNYSRRPPPVWLHRRGFWIDALPGASAEDVASARSGEDRRRRDADAAAVIAAILVQRGRGGYPTGRSLDDQGVLDASGERMPRARLRTAISTATASGHVRVVPLPVDLQRGQRRDYLDVPLA